MTTAAVCFKSGSRLFQERLELSFSFGPPPGSRTSACNGARRSAPDPDAHLSAQQEKLRLCLSVYLQLNHTSDGVKAEEEEVGRLGARGSDNTASPLHRKTPPRSGVRTAAARRRRRRRRMPADFVDLFVVHDSV